ncbi:hypothetical protein A2U01_0114826, partial [Trifolium medium]|nr:hypothetical protein [Trifolium medium]
MLARNSEWSVVREQARWSPGLPVLVIHSSVATFVMWFPSRIVVL